MEKLQKQYEDEFLEVLKIVLDNPAFLFEVQAASKIDTDGTLLMQGKQGLFRLRAERISPEPGVCFNCDTLHAGDEHTDGMRVPGNGTKH